MKKFLLFLMLSLPALAQDPGLLQWSGFQYPAVVQSVTPGGVYVRTSSGLNVMLPPNMGFNVGGQRVEIGSLHPGVPVQVLVPPGQGGLVGVNGDLCTVQGPYGPMQVPMQYFPTQTQQQKVAVRKHNGKIVNVPLNAALNMQRSQGAQILGSSGSLAPVNVPVYDYYDDGGKPGKGNKHGGGKGKGKKK